MPSARSLWAYMLAEIPPTGCMLGRDKNMGQGGCTTQAINRGELFGGTLLSTAQQSGVAVRVPSQGAERHAFPRSHGIRSYGAHTTATPPVVHFHIWKCTMHKLWRYKTLIEYDVRSDCTCFFIHIICKFTSLLGFFFYSFCSWTQSKGWSDKKSRYVIRAMSFAPPQNLCSRRYRVRKETSQLNCRVISWKRRGCKWYKEACFGPFLLESHLKSQTLHQVNMSISKINKWLKNNKLESSCWKEEEQQDEQVKLQSDGGMSSGAE